MMDNNETGVKVPKGQINLNTVLGAIGTAGINENKDNSCLKELFHY